MTTAAPPALPLDVSLGRSPILVCPIGVGAMTWGDDWGGMYGGGYAPGEAADAYRAALAAGITFIDTAEMYSFGKSERVVGALLRQTPPTERPRIATKCFPAPWRLRATSLRGALRASLRRLGLDSVDLYQMHFPSRQVPVADWMEAMADAVNEGLVRAVGVSNYNADQLRRAHDVLAGRGVPLASNQVQYSLLHRAPERDGVLAACQERGVTLLAYMPLHMGLLTGKYTPEHPPKGLLRRISRQSNTAGLRQLQPLLGLLRDVGQQHGNRTPGQVALAWLVQRGALPIPGVRSARQAADLAGAAGWSLSTDEMAALEAATPR